MKPIKYETHPVSPERKAELIAAGFKIIDARFAPAGEVPDVELAHDGAQDSSDVVKPIGRAVAALARWKDKPWP